MNKLQTNNALMRTSVFVAVIAAVFLCVGNSAFAASSVSQPDVSKYNPTINPADFSTTIDNKYFSLPVGMRREYKGKTDEGIETIALTIPGDTKMVMGVKTLVYHDQVWLDGELIEDTTDYLAQHKNGDVWYFGENVDNYENGKLKDHAGTWIAGVDGAKPGIWMKGNPKVGEVYMQEYLKGEAEDFAKVLSVNETVKVPAGTFTKCVKTLDVNPFTSPETDEYKFYCPENKGFTLEIEVETGEKIELTKYSSASTGGVSEDDEDEAGDVDEMEDDDSDDKGGANIAQMEKLISLLKQLIALLFAKQGAN